MLRLVVSLTRFAKGNAMSDLVSMSRADLAALDIRQEIFFSEKSLHDSGEVAAAVADLRLAEAPFLQAPAWAANKAATARPRASVLMVMQSSLIVVGAADGF